MLFYRLTETYLITAEALLMSGKAAKAATYAHTVPERPVRTGVAVAETKANRKAMEVIPGQLTIDCILDERARELIGKGTRRIDLGRTDKLPERVKNNCGLITKTNNVVITRIHEDETNT